MRELPWASPGAIGRLTIVQLFCLGNEKPPGGGPRSAEGFRALAARLAAEEGEWAGKGTGTGGGDDAGK